MGSISQDEITEGQDSWASSNFVQLISLLQIYIIIIDTINNAPWFVSNDIMKLDKVELPNLTIRAIHVWSSTIFLGSTRATNLAKFIKHSHITVNENRRMKQSETRFSIFNWDAEKQPGKDAQTSRVLKVYFSQTNRPDSKMDH